jgi:Family of unknown function (DUF5706)
LDAVTLPLADQPETDFAWRVHAALDSWTGKVDTKASIALAIESAVFGFVVTLTKRGEQFTGLDGSDLTLFRIGSGFLLLAILLSLLVVAPQLNRRESKRIWSSNMIYFGHLRRWDPVELAKTLATQQPYGEQLARQLVTMAKIAWRKHACLQYSLACLVLGAGCLLVLALRV